MQVLDPPIRPVHYSAPQSLDREMVPADVPVPKGRTYVKYMHIILYILYIYIVYDLHLNSSNTTRTP